MAGTSVDPFRSYNFKLDINGITEATFTRCSGIGIDVEAIPYREAGQGQVLRQLPGQVSYQEITLSYGLTNSTMLWDWFMTVVEGKVDRRNVSIIQLAPDGVTEALRWNLENAWPNKWRAPTLDALSRETAIESVALVYETLRRG